MKLAEVREKAFAMPLNDPAYPKGPYKFYNREFVVITYRTDPDVLRALVPEPLEVVGDTVNYEFIRMPDSTGFGDYTETGQVIPVRFRGSDGVVQEGSYVHAMYLDDNSPIAGGREIWGFPKKLASPKITHESETLVCTLHYGSRLCVSATMGYKHRELDPAPILKALTHHLQSIRRDRSLDRDVRRCQVEAVSLLERDGRCARERGSVLARRRLHRAVIAHLRRLDAQLHQTHRRANGVGRLPGGA